MSAPVDLFVLNGLIDLSDELCPDSGLVEDLESKVLVGWWDYNKERLVPNGGKRVVNDLCRGNDFAIVKADSNKGIRHIVLIKETSESFHVGQVSGLFNGDSSHTSGHICRQVRVHHALNVH